MMIGLFTELLSAGGVQRAGRHVAAVAAKFAFERGFACRFLSLNDPQGLHTVREHNRTEFPGTQAHRRNHGSQVGMQGEHEQWLAARRMQSC